MKKVRIIILCINVIYNHHEEEDHDITTNMSPLLVVTGFSGVDCCCK